MPSMIVRLPSCLLKPTAHLRLIALANRSDSRFSAVTFLGQDDESTAAHPIWMDNVQCSGTELTLAECHFRGWGINNCGVSEDVALRCRGLDPFDRFASYSLLAIVFCTCLSMVALSLATVACWQTKKLLLLISQPQDISGRTPPIQAIKVDDCQSLL
jgi:hypothetical protein